MNWEETLKKITNKTAFNAALNWVDTPLNLKLINNQINCVYRFQSQNKGYYLRMTHEQIRPVSELVAAIDFQEHLFKSKVPVCQAILSKNTLFIETIKQDKLSFLAHICLEVPGTIMHFDSQEKSVYKTWGQSLALLHKASQSYEPKELYFRTWKDLWKETDDYAKQDTNQIQELHDQINTWFNKHVATPLNFGLTHGDHRPGNVLYDGHQIHIIDFDEPVYHWFMADIAKPFLDLCDKPYRDWKPLFEWYIEGYRSILPITDEDLQSINWFTQMKSLDIYLWCKNNWCEPAAPGGKPRNKWLSELLQMALTPLFK